MKRCVTERINSIIPSLSPSTTLKHCLLRGASVYQTMQDILGKIRGQKLEPHHHPSFLFLVDTAWYSPSSEESTDTSWWPTVCQVQGWLRVWESIQYLMSLVPVRLFLSVPSDCNHLCKAEEDMCLTDRCSLF